MIVAPLPPLIVPLRVPPATLVAAVKANTQVTARQVWILSIVFSLGLVHKLQSKQGRVDPERILRQLEVAGRGGNIDGLLRLELIFERSLDVGMNQKLRARSEPVAG